MVIELDRGDVLASPDYDPKIAATQVLFYLFLLRMHVGFVVVDLLDSIRMKNMCHDFLMF